MVAYVRASQDYQHAFVEGKAPAEWYVKIMQKHTKAKDAGLYSSMKPAGLDPWGKMDMKSMREDYDWFKERKLIISKDVKFEDPFDTSFLDFAKNYIQKNSP